MLPCTPAGVPHKDGIQHDTHTHSLLIKQMTSHPQSLNTLYIQVQVERMGGAPLYGCAWWYYLRVWLWLLFILGLLRALKNVIYQLSDSTKPPVQTSKVWLELSRSQWERKQPVRPLSEQLGSKNQTEATTFTMTSAETVRAVISGALTTRHSVEKEGKRGTGEA